jgi:hypothetical protein
VASKFVYDGVEQDYLLLATIVGLDTLITDNDPVLVDYIREALAKLGETMYLAEVTGGKC